VWIARTPELAALTDALRVDRLAVLHGPIGIGKTALVARLELPFARTRRDAKLVRAPDARVTLASALGITRSDAATIGRVLASRDDELVVLDDADDAAELLPELVRPRATGARVLLVTRVDPGFGHRISLGPVDDDVARELFTDQVRDASLRDELVARCRGIPFLLALARGWLDELDPRSVLAVLGERGEANPLHAVGRRAIAQLARAERGQVRALAVFPATFSVEEAAPALGVRVPHALRITARLLKLGVLVSQPLRGGARLALARPLRDVCPAPRPTRALLAAIVANAELELARAEAARAGSDEGWSRVAAVEPNLELVVEHAPTTVLAQRAATLIHRLRAALGPLRAPDHVAKVSVTTAALALARAEVARLAGEPTLARREIAHALALAPSDSELMAEAHRRAAHLARSEGAWSEAERALERAFAGFRALGSARGEAHCLAEEAFALAARGRFDEAAQRQRTALALLERAGNPSERAVARSYLAVHLHRAGRLTEAEELHRLALAEHDALGANRYAAAERMHLGYVAHELGRLDEAMLSLELARAAQRALGDVGLEALSCVYLARVASDRGRVSDGEQLVAEASILTRDDAPAPQHAARDVVVGHLAMERGAHRVAADAYARAFARVRSPTVGFEALTGAYLAVALHAAGERGAKLRKALRASERVLHGVRHPHLHFALAILARHVRGEPSGDDPPAAAVTSSSEIRRALRFTRTAVVRPFRVSEDGKLVVTPEARRIDLSRRRALRLVVLALLSARRTAPGRALSPDEVAAAGWPGERLRATAAEQRVYTLIWTLRRDLFGEALLRRDDGYLLRPDVDFEFL
jgi:tetratricopeptide (TPR) repeat protein